MYAFFCCASIGYDRFFSMYGSECDLSSGISVYFFNAENPFGRNFCVAHTVYMARVKLMNKAAISYPTNYFTFFLLNYSTKDNSLHEKTISYIYDLRAGLKCQVIN